MLDILAAGRPDAYQQGAPVDAQPQPPHFTHRIAIEFRSDEPPTLRSTGCFQDLPGTWDDPSAALSAPRRRAPAMATNAGGKAEQP
jgi:hypothetical protein